MSITEEIEKAQVEIMKFDEQGEEVSLTMPELYELKERETDADKIYDSFCLGFHRGMESMRNIRKEESLELDALLFRHECITAMIHIFHNSIVGSDNIASPEVLDNALYGIIQSMEEVNQSLDKFINAYRIWNVDSETN